MSFLSWTYVAERMEMRLRWDRETYESWWGPREWPVSSGPGRVFDLWTLKCGDKTVRIPGQLLPPRAGLPPLLPGQPAARIRVGAHEAMFGP
ncbi:hypothetical protein B0H67DRAFT_591989 [Lasiosphaeris hirsuta]|uniref:Uncharacterized protein n=1 Tax=Lasiosphaeris hirsuta TaxID=260670 RepID=A0AA39ZW19_9PEZI|nr:hypothetical protein B0H67DRAFT_591989 [Lasiosphaeris hirsuta]